MLEEIDGRASVCWFSKCPIEVQEQIWAYTWEARNVSIRPVPHSPPGSYALTFMSTNYPPASMLVNQASRALTSRKYHRTLSVSDSKKYQLSGYFHPPLDILEVDAESRDILPSVLSSMPVRHIRLTENVPSPGTNGNHPWIDENANYDEVIELGQQFLRTWGTVFSSASIHTCIIYDAYEIDAGIGPTEYRFCRKGSFPKGTITRLADLPADYMNFWDQSLQDFKPECQFGTFRSADPILNSLGAVVFPERLFAEEEWVLLLVLQTKTRFPRKAIWAMFLQSFTCSKRSIGPYSENYNSEELKQVTPIDNPFARAVRRHLGESLHPCCHFFGGVCRPSFGLEGVNQEPPYGLPGVDSLESGHPWVMDSAIQEVFSDRFVLADMFADEANSRENICFKAWKRIIEKDLRLENENKDLNVRTGNP